jgi:hypothetical protein
VHTYQLDSNEQRLAKDRKNIIPSAPSATLGETITITTEVSNWSAAKIFLLVIGLILVCLSGIGAYFYRKNRRRGPRFY